MIRLVLAEVARQNVYVLSCGAKIKGDFSYVQLCSVMLTDDCVLRLGVENEGDERRDRDGSRGEL